MKKTTIYSLSKDLGVSPATISKALNNSPEISTKTAERVRKAAREKGFSPRPVSSKVINICALIQKSSATDNCFSPYTIAIMQGMMEYIQENDLEFSLFSDEYSKLNDGLLMRHLGRRGVDGAVLINTNEDSLFYDEFNNNIFPYCSLLTNHGKNRYNLLTIDNAAAASQAVTHLIQLGHRNIATIVTPAHGVTGKERLQGYLGAMEQAGLPVKPEWILQDNSLKNSLEFGRHATFNLLKRNPSITALLVMGEQVAIGALHALYQLKKTVPDDLSLLTFDDAPEVSYFTPPLTVMRIPNHKLGYAATHWVHQMVKGTNEKKSICEPWMCGELVIRESTTAPRVQH